MAPARRRATRKPAAAKKPRAKRKPVALPAFQELEITVTYAAFAGEQYSDHGYGPGQWSGGRYWVIVGDSLAFFGKGTYLVGGEGAPMTDDADTEIPVPVLKRGLRLILDTTETDVGIEVAGHMFRRVTVGKTKKIEYQAACGNKHRFTPEILEKVLDFIS